MPTTKPIGRCILALAASVLWSCEAVGGIDTPQGVPLNVPLACTFKAVQAGQFHGPEFVPAPTGGTTNLLLAASPVDLRLGRIAVIEDDHAQVADTRFDAQQVTILGRDGASAMVLSLFTVAANGAVIPAAMSRQNLIGTIPVVTQGVGSCRPI